VRSDRDQATFADGRIRVTQDPFSFQGLTALVCGASRGIGKASAQMLASCGARVVLLARDADALESVRRSLPTVAAGSHQALSADASDARALGEGVRACLEQMGSVHILINNTGGPKAGPLLDADLDAFTAALGQHVLAAQTLVKLVLPGMKEAGYGRIVNVLSTSVRVPIAGLGVSNTIRAAMAGWAKTLAGEVGPHGVTVNNVLPGYTTTERFRELVKAAAARAGKTESDIETAWRAAVPLGRFASPEEVAGAVCYFASPAASYVTGQSLAVDGGRIGAI